MIDLHDLPLIQSDSVYDPYFVSVMRWFLGTGRRGSGSTSLPPSHRIGTIKPGEPV